MITAIVSAIKGPILSIVSGCLGESGMLRLWLWNLVPTQVNMLGSDVSWNCRAPYGTSGQKTFLVVREIYAKHGLGDEIKTRSL